MIKASHCCTSADLKGACYPPLSEVQHVRFNMKAEASFDPGKRCFDPCLAPYFFAGGGSSATKRNETDNSSSWKWGRRNAIAL